MHVVVSTGAKRPQQVFDGGDGEAAVRNAFGI